MSNRLREAGCAMGDFQGLANTGAGTTRSLVARRSWKGLVAGVGALLLAPCLATVAEAACTSSGTLGAAAAGFGFGALANSAAGSANSFVSSISTMDTAFLAQGNAFVGSPKSDTPDFTAG